MRTLVSQRLAGMAEGSVLFSPSCSAVRPAGAQRCVLTKKVQPVAR